jgi:hypothetical protein
MVNVDWDIVHNRVKALGVWTYWIVGLIIASTISYVLFTRFNKQVAALLVFMTTVLALYYYYVKWFIIPTYELPISMCPDFMTNIGVVPSTVNRKPQFVCVDHIGVSPSFNSDDAKVATVTMVAEAAGTIPENGKVSASSAPGYVITPTADANINTFCTDLKNAGMSWIGRC